MSTPSASGVVAGDDPATAIRTAGSGANEEKTHITTERSTITGTNATANVTTDLISHSTEPNVTKPGTAAEAERSVTEHDAAFGPAATASHAAVDRHKVVTLTQPVEQDHVMPEKLTTLATPTSGQDARKGQSTAESNISFGHDMMDAQWTTDTGAPNQYDNEAFSEAEPTSTSTFQPQQQQQHLAPASHHPSEDSSSFSTPSVGGSFRLSVDTDSDTDSALGSILPNSSMSATSSVYQFVEEFGRTFHRYKEGIYFLPNDEQEINRLDLQHRIALQVLDWKLYLAPISSPNRVLDLGTGTGIWAIEFADQNPESDVLGTDLSPIQPEYVPANCRFEIDDAEDEWLYSQKFDYIHGRYMCAFLSDFPKLFRNIYDNLIPGGWVEFMETLIYFQSHDGTLEGTALQRWNRLIIEGMSTASSNTQHGTDPRDRTCKSRGDTY